MEVLLLQDIPGVGKKNDLLIVKSGYALNHLLPLRKALVVTPNVRRRFAEQIKQRALEKEHEKQLLGSITSVLTGITLHFTAKATKTGKLYAAISEDKIVESLKKDHAINLTAEAVKISKPIKTVGTHSVTISIGTQMNNVSIEVKAEE
jgi:large subunit ribosomal protein L9